MKKIILRSLGVILLMVVLFFVFVLLDVNNESRIHSIKSDYNYCMSGSIIEKEKDRCMEKYKIDMGALR